jgi:Fe-S-cluster containining protein
MTQRTCGNCQVCCTVYGIRELDKPTSTRCRHLYEHGCNIYPLRPDECRRFRCGWLLGFGGDNDRPDASGFVVSAIRNGDEVIIRYDASPGVDVVDLGAFHRMQAAIEAAGESKQVATTVLMSKQFTEPTHV